MAILFALLLFTGCQRTRQAPVQLMSRGEYGAARQDVRQHMTNDRRDRQYLLDRMKLGILTLADGYPRAAQTTFEQVYEILRTQGINRDKTVASVVINEDIKFWKGEPFEQAMAMFYYGAQQASTGSWDNARAAANSSLFSLRDFGRNQRGERINTLEIAQRAMEYERVKAGGAPENASGGGADYLNTGYAVRESNFTLGYLMTGLAAQQLGRVEEASDYYAVALQLNAALRPLIDELASGQYNTLLLVSYGAGPQKVAYGPDGALARFQPRTPSDSRALEVRVGGGQRSYPLAADLNAMAADHMWNNLEDVRVAKSTLGSLAMLGGATAATVGAAHGSEAALYAGLGALAAGLFMKAGAHADTTHLDALPQRIYVVPLLVAESGATVELQVMGTPASRLVLTGLAPPPSGAGASGGEAQLRYVRLMGGAPGASLAPPPWATSGQIYYANDYADPTAAHTPLPFILGGHGAETPSEAVLTRYQQAGYLRDLTLSDLRELYRAEGIAWQIEHRGGLPGRHVLEGGRSLVTPLPGTTGFARLFGQIHPPYRPRSQTVRDMAARQSGKNQ